MSVTYKEFFAATKRCRALQETYFAGGRKREDLIIAKAAEATLDKLIALIDTRRPIEDGGGVQVEMFGGEGAR